MSEEEIKTCKFISEEMRYYTYEDFLRNGKAIRRLYNTLEYKLFYRWYVYSHEMSLKKKESIWCFLNNDITYEELRRL